MKTVKIKYAGATIEILDFLERVWPYELKAEQWPHYCGAGDGWGEKIVPESIHGIRVSHLCFDHDCGYSTGPDTKEAWHKHNSRFYRNLLSTMISSDLQGKELILAVNECAMYYLAVESPVGYLNFAPNGEDVTANKELKEKISKLQAEEAKILGVAH